MFEYSLHGNCYQNGSNMSLNISINILFLTKFGRNPNTHELHFNT